MRILVSGTTASVSKFHAERPDRLGVLLTAEDGNGEWWEPGMAWACDNSCFKGLDAPAFLRLVARVLEFETRPLWIACPDVVADAAETLRRFDVWQPLLAEVGLPVALVGQDGLNLADVPWDRLDAVFIGGSTAWKVGDDAARLTLEAHDRGKLAHVGRVNSRKRILYFARRMRDGEAWVDTFDGSGWSAWGEARIPLGIRWIDESLADRQLVLCGGTA